jgi:hypothetical protein
MSYCNDVDGLMKSLGHDHKQEEWQLLNDATRASLKVLLHIGNAFPSFPVFHSTHMKSHIRTCNFPSAAYNITHCWNICGHFKVTALLLGMQLGFAKFCCFLLETDSHAKRSPLVKECPKHEQFNLDNSVRNEPILHPKKIFLLPLHTKLGTMKNFVNAFVCKAKTQ